MIKKSLTFILILAMLMSVLSVASLSAAAQTTEDGGSPCIDDDGNGEHQWVWQGNDVSHWQYCTACGVHTRTREHEKGEMKAEIQAVTEPLPLLGSATGRPLYVLFVKVYNECPVCLHQTPVAAYNVSHSYDLSLYKIAARRHAVISKSCNAIYMEGDYSKKEMVFWDGVMLNKSSVGKSIDYVKEQGSVILHFTDDFLQAAQDGDHELLVLNGDEFIVMTVTVRDHFLVDLSEKDFSAYEQVSYNDYLAQLKDYENHNASIINCDLDQTLPLLGDIDSDGDVTILDVTWMQRKLARITVNKSLDNSVADVDGDGEISITDVTAIQRWLTDLPTAFLIKTPTPGSDTDFSFA